MRAKIRLLHSEKYITRNKRKRIDLCPCCGELVDRKRWIEHRREHERRRRQAHELD